MAIHLILRETPLNSPIFKTIGVISKRTHPESLQSAENIITYLTENQYSVLVADDIIDLLKGYKPKALPQDELGQVCDLIIVVGGDGHLLSAARSVFLSHVPLIGVNRGRFGFLADLSPQDLPQNLAAILKGQYVEEQRCLLTAKVIRNQKIIMEANALNEVILNTGGITRMLEFDLLINDRFVLRQRSDGLITATPTGSTAYALSGGGPILHPDLAAFVLVPMFPHTLSSRPLVVPNNSRICLRIPPQALNPRLSWDGQIQVDLQANDDIVIEKHPNTLRLLHPTSYDYFRILQEKLGWQTSPGKSD